MDVDVLPARVEADLGQLCSDLEVPGASVVVVHGGRVVNAVCGVVNTRSGVPVTADALFQIQSVTKVFTAAMVMQLVDEGVVDLDAPVRTYLPDFHTADTAASERITVRHLLTHTGGFEGDLWQPTTSGDDALERFVVDLVSAAAQYSPPGQRFSYCNAGFGTLGRLVEVLRGVTYEKALRRHLATPLGIDELAFSADQALAFRTAIGHVRPTPAATLRPMRQWALMPPSNPAAGNQLAMSARGLAAFGRMFVSRGCAVDGEQVLTPESAEAMLRPQLRQRDNVSTPTYQGLGWVLPQSGIAEHGGGAPGTAALLVIAPDHDLVAAVLANADAGAQLARMLLAPLLDELAHVSATPPLPLPDLRTRVVDPTVFLGRYANRQSTVEVSCDRDGRLWLARRPQNEEAEMGVKAGIATTVERYEIRPIGSDTFVRLDHSGQPVGTIAFFDPDRTGRYRLVADERVAARSD